MGTYQIARAHRLVRAFQPVWTAVSSRVHRLIRRVQPLMNITVQVIFLIHYFSD
jgi:hypothetical protein